MNHASTKALVEFLHAYLNFLSKFFDSPLVTVEANQAGLEFVCEHLSNA